jgi:hypothetical protein
MVYVVKGQHTVLKAFLKQENETKFESCSVLMSSSLLMLNGDKHNKMNVYWLAWSVFRKTEIKFCSFQPEIKQGNGRVYQKSVSEPGTR